ncbi:MAG: phosphoribosylformylglycinamidine cyclo-ligase [Spirochaetota bacterium]|nr:phosphoribosylformylglycinamidine cyclo-ligase [Spirochaetota bacterium]
MGLTYKDSGVDINRGKSFVDKIKPLLRSTFSNRVITDIGGFSSLFSASFDQMKEPVLVSGTDGVGTKLKIAQMMNIHNTIGIDAVAMCVNDIITSGARPLFFLDYISCGRLNESLLVEVVNGIAEGCKIADCSLIGGETAEHPDVMDPNEYDIAGFSVGVVDRVNIINGAEIKKGDIIVGLKSSGIHSNGYSLLRKLFFEIKQFDVDTFFPDLSGTLGEALLIPTRIYSKGILNCIDHKVRLKGIIHITGGGFYENIPRILPEGLSAKIDRSYLEIPAIFNLVQREGEIEDREMYSTFNMGIGMMLVVDRDDEGKTIELLQESEESAIVIGEIVKDKDEQVIIA